MAGADPLRSVATVRFPEGRSPANFGVGRGGETVESGWKACIQCKLLTMTVRYLPHPHRFSCPGVTCRS